jgi:hypothetical protein
MTNPLSKSFLAAVLLSSIPLAAFADGRGCDHDRDATAAWPAAASYPGAPGAYPPPPPASREWRWRAHERAEVRAELRALDADRARFHAENAWRPGRIRKYERWYAVRRAELERRLYDLQPVAWR